MKKNIIKTSLLSIVFIIFLIYTIFLFIDCLSVIVFMSNGGHSIWSSALNAFHIEIDSLWFKLFAFLCFAIITIAIGYMLCKSAISLYKTYKAKYENEIAAKKAARAEADKQAKIAQLEAELKELKKD